MKLVVLWRRYGRVGLVMAAAGVILGLVVGGTSSWASRLERDRPEAEFHLARLAYSTVRFAGSRPGVYNPMWAVDYPYAELHFVPALRRMTTISAADAVGDGRRHLQVTDDRIFQYPFLWMQQPGGNWRPTEQEVARLKEYLMRGGFVFVDDFHGERDWRAFQSAMARVLPDRPIMDIPADDPLMSIFFDLNQHTAIPGIRHLRWGRGRQIVARMPGPPRWRGIYDDHGRLVVGINFNMDVGDAWEHADDPYYPVPMTVEAYRLGVNYVIYAMTH